MAQQSLEALKIAKQCVSNNFDSLAELDNNDGWFNSTIEAGLAATKSVLSAEMYQNIMRSVLDRELKLWKVTRENAAFDRAEEAKERESSSSSSSSGAGSKRGRGDDDVDARIGFTKDDTDKLAKRIREAMKAQLNHEEKSLGKLKFFKDQAKKVERAVGDEDADIQEVRPAPHLKFACHHCTYLRQPISPEFCNRALTIPPTLHPHQVKSAPKEADFQCPYSKSTFESPMTNGQCPHRVDESSLKQMCKGGKASHCPVVGCSKLWNLTGATVDVDFKRRLEKFKKFGASQKEQSEAIALDDDEYDEMA